MISNSVKSCVGSISEDGDSKAWFTIRRKTMQGLPIKIKFMEHTRAWLLNSSCSDVVLAMQE